jgi:hypothetical protein
MLVVAQREAKAKLIKRMLHRMMPLLATRGKERVAVVVRD